MPYARGLTVLPKTFIVDCLRKITLWIATICQLDELTFSQSLNHLQTSHHVICQLTLSTQGVHRLSHCKICKRIRYGRWIHAFTSCRQTTPSNLNARILTSRKLVFAIRWHPISDVIGPLFRSCHANVPLRTSLRVDDNAITRSTSTYMSATVSAPVKRGQIALGVVRQRTAFVKQQKCLHFYLMWIINHRPWCLNAKFGYIYRFGTSEKQDRMA